jgi:hypothetical protein
MQPAIDFHAFISIIPMHTIQKEELVYPTLQQQPQLLKKPSKSAKKGKMQRWKKKQKHLWGVKSGNR